MVNFHNAFNLFYSREKATTDVPVNSNRYSEEFIILTNSTNCQLRLRYGIPLLLETAFCRRYNVGLPTGNTPTIENYLSAMKSKVEAFENYIIKHNTARYSAGLEWITELLSVNHNRELRAYRWYDQKPHKHLLIPQHYVLDKRYIKIEKLVGSESGVISVSDIIPNIKEFVLMGEQEFRNIFDLISSPTQSVVRGLIRNAKFLGIRTTLTALKHLFLLQRYSPKKGNMYLIHKDLKIDQNMIKTDKGVYFIDFGSSILTKHYFLADIVELATDHIANTVDFDLLRLLIQELGSDQFHIQYLRSQIYLLLLRRTLHFGPKSLDNSEIMNNVKEFHNSLESLVNNFEL